MTASRISFTQPVAAAVAAWGLPTNRNMRLCRLFTRMTAPSLPSTSTEYEQLVPTIKTQWLAWQYCRRLLPGHMRTVSEPAIYEMSWRNRIRCRAGLAHCCPLMRRLATSGRSESHTGVFSCSRYMVGEYENKDQLADSRYKCRPGRLPGRSPELPARGCLTSRPRRGHVGTAASSAHW